MNVGRKDCTTGVTRCLPKNRKQALYCQINHSHATRTEIAEVMDVNPATLGKWGDPQLPDERIPDDRLEHLLQLTDDNPAWATYYATSLQGFVVYDPKQTVNGQTARMVGEFGDLLKALDAQADGTSPEDVERIEKEAHELIAAIQIAVDKAKRDAVPALKAVK